MLFLVFQRPGKSEEIMAKKKTKKKLSGKPYMRNKGYTKCEVWLDATERGVIDEALSHGRMPLATYIRVAAVAAAAALCSTKRARPAEK
jgi:hypothetical protein